MCFYQGIAGKAIGKTLIFYFEKPYFYLPGKNIALNSLDATWL